MRRIVRLFAIAAMLILLLGVIAAPAGATIEEVAGDCSASGDFEPGGLKDAAAAELTIPSEATVTWSGAVAKPPPETPRRVEGSVVLELPMGQSVTLGSWSASGRVVANEGVYDYDVTDWISNIPMTLRGEHFEDDTLWCKGQIKITVEGSNPLAWPAAALTVVSFVGVGLSITYKGRGETDIIQIDPSGDPPDPASSDPGFA